MANSIQPKLRTFDITMIVIGLVIGMGITMRFLSYGLSMVYISALINSELEVSTCLTTIDHYVVIQEHVTGILNTSILLIILLVKFTTRRQSFSRFVQKIVDFEIISSSICLLFQIMYVAIYSLYPEMLTIINCGYIAIPTSVFLVSAVMDKARIWCENCPKRTQKCLESVSRSSISSGHSTIV